MKIKTLSQAEKISARGVFFRPARILKNRKRYTRKNSDWSKNN